MCLYVGCFSKNLPNGEIVVPMVVLKLPTFYEKHVLRPDVLICGPTSCLSDRQCCNVVIFCKFVICACIKILFLFQAYISWLLSRIDSRFKLRDMIVI